MALVLNRRDGIVMLAAVLLATAPMWAVGVRARLDGAWGRVRRRAGQNRSPVTVAAVGLALVVLVVVIGRFGAYAVDFVRNPGSRRDTAGFMQALGTIPGYFAEMIGRFGWLDTPVGPVFVGIGLVLVAIVVLLAVAAAPARLGLAALWAMVVVAGVVVASEMIEYTYLQARYVFPVWFAALICAGVALDRAELPARLTARLSVMMLVLWAGLQFGSLYTNQRRYSVGLSEAWDFSAPSQWDPPVISNTEVMMLFAAALISAGALWWWLERDRSGAAATSTGGGDPAIGGIDHRDAGFGADGTSGTVTASIGEEVGT
jgi:hypothetical protein